MAILTVSEAVGENLTQVPAKPDTPAAASGRAFGSSQSGGTVIYNRSVLIACCVSLTACAGHSPVAGPPVPELSGSHDRVWFTGSSNIRNFTCSAREVFFSTEAAPEEFDRTRKDGVPAIRSAALEVPVRSLDCGIGLQNSHLFETLRASAHPSILFVLKDYTVESSGIVPRIQMNGALRIAGVERNVVFQGTMLRDVNGCLMLMGEREMDVREFGVVPPKRFLGLLRVRNTVTIHFAVAVRPLIDPLSIVTASLQ